MNLASEYYLTLARVCFQNDVMRPSTLLRPRTISLSPFPVIVLCLLVAAAACTRGNPGEPGPGSSAGALAAAIAQGMTQHTLDGVPLTRDVDSETFAALVSPLDDQPVTVEVSHVEEADDAATATLEWRWDVHGHDWNYTSRAQLRKDNDQWRLDWRPSVLEPSLNDGDRLGLFTSASPRGRILGDDGTILVTDRPVLRYGLDKSQVQPSRVGRSARAIARALEVDADSFARQAEAAGPKAFVEALTLRAQEARDRISPSYADIPGAVLVKDTLPLAPTREFAAPVLGRVGPATAELIDASEGQVSVGDEVGLSGLQQRYEDQLAGRPGLDIVAVDDSEERRILFTVRPQRGADLHTTLDPKLQIKAETALASLGQKGPPSALVAIRPSDGALLSVANGPGNAGREVAASGQYAPGSTFKVVTALALLRKGVTLGQVLPCPNTANVDGRVFNNYSGYPDSQLGAVSFTTAFAYSCNTAMISARDRLDRNDLPAAAAALGIGPDADLGFPAYFGQVPPPRGETEKAADLIGQGTVLASPMAMATVAASVVKGRTVTPHLLPDRDATPRRAEQPLTAEETTALRKLMRAVVVQGSGSFLADVPGDVGAKTGTAEYGKPNPSGALPTHAWMIATRGDLAISVFVETGESGSQTAGPILKEFLS